MSRRCAAGLLLIVLVLPAAAAPAPRPAPGGDEQVPLAETSDFEQATLRSLVENEHWPFRVFGLSRLPRYDRLSAEPIVRRALADETWQVRCFALLHAGRMGLEVTDEDLAEEKSAHVIRAVLRHLRPLPEARLVPLVRPLLRTPDVEDFILGLELAAASDVPSLRTEATRRLMAFIRNLDHVRAVVASRRLGRLLEVADPPTTPAGWQQWLHQRGPRDLLPPPRVPGGPTDSRLVRTLMGGASPLPDMDANVFAQLRDYLASLKQRDLDVAIVMDCTMSMLPAIDEARSGIDELILFLGDISRSMRMAFVAYRDYHNAPVVEGHPFTRDLPAIRRFLFALAVTGGHDMPEAVLEGVKACAQLDWNPRAERQIIVVGDARPHAEDGPALRSLLVRAGEEGTPVHTVHVPMRPLPAFEARLPPHEVEIYRRDIVVHNAETEQAFRQMAELSGGEMVQLHDARQLVPAIMHFSISRAWWPVFDSFYQEYLELCR